MTVIDLGAGLGGATRVIAAETGAWITGYEESALLTEAGSELSTMAGLNRKAPVEQYDPSALDLRASSCNTIFSKEAFFTIEDKDALFEAIYQALRIDGQLLFTDYMFSRSNISSGAIDAWVENEPVTPKPWSVDDVRNKLTTLGFEVRITEDVTPDIRNMILAAWSEFTSAFDHMQLEPGWAPAILAEAELWTGRVNVLDSGDVGIYRIYGRKFDPALKR
jgi:cyclopropane fatty-acyl-phospholipid synthase-like methyltransferase